jgi:UDP-glucose 4-epimerase
MRVLVTGGAGFIGSHLVALLVQKGVELRVLDSLVSGKREWIPAEAEFIEGDIRDASALSTVMRDITRVVHLAAHVSVAESMTDPLKTHEVNVMGTENVLNAMRIAGVQRIVYATSAAVYGNDPSLPKTASSPLSPQSPYALSKVLNEMQTKMYKQIFGLLPTGLRFFNVYGPGQLGDHPYASVIPRWIEAVRAGRPILVNGDGSQTRDFVHVRDVVGAMYKALMIEDTGIFNIASGEETSLKDLLHIIESVNRAPVEITYESARKGDIIRSVADISAARRVLGFEPTMRLTEGISELLTI